MFFGSKQRENNVEIYQVKVQALKLTHHNVQDARGLNTRELLLMKLTVHKMGRRTSRC